MKYLSLIIFFCLASSCILVAQKDSSSSTTKRDSISSVTQESAPASPRAKEIYLSGGFSNPYLPLTFRNDYKTGWNIGGGYGWSFDPGSVGYSTVYATADYSLFKFDDSGYVNSLPSGAIKKISALTARPTKAFTLMINYKGTFSSTKHTIAPYFLLGVGYMFVSNPGIVAFPDTDFSVGATNRSTFTWSFGVGVEVPLSDQLGFYVQDKSTLGVFDQSRQYFPFSFGLRYRFY